MIQRLRLLLTLVLLPAIQLTGQDSLVVSDTTGMMDTTLVVLDTTLEETSQTPQTEILNDILVYTEEDSYRRWLTLSLSTHDSTQQVAKPMIQSTSREGQFTLALAGLEGRYTAQRSLFKDVGHFPLQYELIVSEEDSLFIKGNTVPFEFIKSTFSFDSNEYLIEIIYSEAVSLGKGSDTKQHVSKSMGKTDTKLPRLATSRSGDLKDLFMQSLVIAGGSFSLVLLILISWFLVKARRRKAIRPSFGDVLENRSNTPSPNPSEPDTPANTEVSRPLTPEQKEAQIREIMAKDDLTYDEATLRIQYQDPGVTDE